MPLAWRTNLHWYFLGLLHESTSLLPKLTMVVAIAIGLACSGFAEDAERNYPFPTVPRSILERLGEMELGEPAAVDPAEWIILQEAWTLRDSLDAEKQTPEYDQLVVKLMLAASGVVTEEAQAPYLRKLEALIAGARVAVDKGKPETHPGDSLIKFLHGGVMHGGYESGQSSFAAVFDSGIYNCVSSTAMYYVIGRELGLEMQIISIPGGSFLSGHACLNLVDGDRTYEVELTNPDGFDWGTKLSQPGVFTIGFQPNRKDGHIVDGIGLAATIYSNRGVDASKAESPDRIAAVSLGLRALMCDPYDSSSAQNVLAHASRSIDSITEGSRFAYALSVADVYAVMIDSAQEPQQLQAQVWENRARNLADQKKWSESIEKSAEGLKAVPGNERLVNGAVLAIDDWADEAMTLKDWDGAVTVYDRGLKYFPENGHLKNNRQYCLGKKAEN